MSHEFRLPDIGEGLTDAEIVQWHVSVGDDVVIDQLVIEIETAKTAAEITSTHSGTVLELRGAAGDTINVGDVLFVIGDQPVGLQEDVTQEPDTDRTDDLEVERGRSSEQVETPRIDLTGAPTRSPTRPMAMPIVRKLARQAGC